VITPARFRLDFPEFEDTATYPDPSIATWLGVAAVLLQNTERWGTLLPIGSELCAAHFIVLGAYDQATAALGGIAGKVKGLETAKSVADISVSCDVTTGSYAGAGSWNLTSYGLRFYALARMIGAGGIQLPGC
jgi:hypothetical protein